MTARETVHRHVGPIIAVRRLTRDKPARIVTVSLGKPRPVPGSDWGCPFAIEGLGRRITDYGFGVDAFQALLDALEAIRRALERSQRHAQWIGAYPGENDHGFYRVVVAAFGRRFTERVNRTIDRALDAEGKRLERRYRRRQRARSSSQGRRRRAAR